jgi:hypothetical protein
MDILKALNLKSLKTLLHVDDDICFFEISKEILGKGQLMVRMSCLFAV